MGRVSVRIAVGWASESSANLGVRALARGSRDLLRRVWPDAHIEYVDFGHKPPELRLGRIRSLVRERMLGERGMMRWLSGFDLWWDTRSGDSFSDIYGLPRHAKMSLLAEFARQAGATVALAPQTIGPFRTARGTVLARRNLRTAALAFARDPNSAAAAAELGRPVDHVGTDLVFGIEQPTPGPSRDVLLNVSGLLWQPNPHVDHERYRQQTRALIRRLDRDGRQVTLLPHVIDSADADNDAPLARRLAQELDVDVHVPTDLDDVRAVIAGAQLVIGARMHACLNALSTGTPALALAYSRKAAPLLQALGWPHVFAIDDSSDLHARVADHAADASLTAQAAATRARGRAAIALVEQDLRARL